MFGHRNLAKALALFLVLTGSASGQDAAFPSKPMKIVVPYPPGASTDLISRAVAEEAGKKLGQPIIIENRPGGGTVIATRYVKTSPADGYTVMFQASGLVSNLIVFKDPGYTLTDFTPVTTLSDAAYVLLVPSNLGVNTLAEFINYAKANRGKMNYGSLGRGTQSHILADRLATDAGFEWDEINFKGTAEAAQAVMAGTVQGYLSTQAFAAQQLSSDKLKLIAITSEQRVSFLPNVPTFVEQGFKNIVDGTWYALFVRSDTPKPIVEKLRGVLAEVVQSDQYKQQLDKNGLSPYKGDVVQLPARLDAELKEKSAEFKRLKIDPQ